MRGFVFYSGLSRSRLGDDRRLETFSRLSCDVREEKEERAVLLIPVRWSRAALDVFTLWITSFYEVVDPACMPNLCLLIRSDT